MYYVYIIQSIPYPEKQYVGFSTDLTSRLDSHNNGYSKYTKKYRPWHLSTYLGFDDMNKARKFEEYLKTGSGRVFSKRHF